MSWLVRQTEVELCSGSSRDWTRLQMLVVRYLQER